MRKISKLISSVLALSMIAAPVPITSSYAENVMPDEGFDLAFVDTWRDAGDGAPMYRRMKALEHLSKNTRFMYWIEGFLKSRVRAERFSEIKGKIDGGKDFSYEEIRALLDEKLLDQIM